jgi:DNA polymerase type B, organellar and viral
MTAPTKRQCRNRACRHRFIPSTSRQVYCSDGCRHTKIGHEGRSESRRAKRDAPPRFVGVDGEGVQGRCGEAACDCRAFRGLGDRCQACGHGRYEHEHTYVLLGCGDRQIENVDGLHYLDIFRFLYSCFEADPDAAYVGFFLGYDFTQWLKTLPEGKAWLLLTEAGRAKRSMRLGEKPWTAPVRLNEEGMDAGEAWEVEWLAARRLSIRPMRCDCQIRQATKCSHKRPPWMHICDAGPYFQTSFLKVINPAEWPDGPVCSQEEYDLVVKGKAARSDAQLDDEMRLYNAMENRILARVMSREAEGFEQFNIHLAKSEWYGPGSAAAKFMQVNGVPRREAIEQATPLPVRQSAQSAYVGGWFEVFVHGHVPGVTHEYDINSAYPHVISQLPCLLHGRWKHSTNQSPALPRLKAGQLCLVRARVAGTDPHIGAMLHRRRNRSICRPRRSGGWYWSHELAAAARAGLVSEIDVSEVWTYTPCKCPPPLGMVSDLYAYRLQVGKKTSAGKAAKLVMNSLYGKTAQSMGGRPFANYLYAGLITAGCRTMILDAIATHPDRSAAVIMVATDAVFFTSPHPSLPLSDSELGRWSHEERTNLCVFKPGVYWDDKARQAIDQRSAPIFKARGINAVAFSKHLRTLDNRFTAISEMGRAPAVWPSISYASGFAMVTAKMALQRRKWGTAGRVSDAAVVQSSNPSSKRTGVAVVDGVIRSAPFEGFDEDESVPYLSPGVEFEMALALGATDPEPVAGVESWVSPDGDLASLAMGMLGTGQWA